jgi:hypothetical protein
VRHALPWQQPSQDVPSHTHAPPRQRCPAAQIGPVPHPHAPPRQLSASCASHALHAAPGTAQLSNAIGEHVSPLQHPEVHDVASHTHRLPAQC